MSIKELYKLAVEIVDTMGKSELIEFIEEFGTLEQKKRVKL